MRTARTLTILATGLVATGILGTTASIAWAQELEDEGWLLPGTTIADVDVGGATVAEATRQVDEHLDDRLATSVDLHAADGRWTVAPDDLEATADVDAAVAEAFAHTRDAGPVELAMHQLLDRPADVEVEVTTDLDHRAIERLVADIAQDIERAPRDAELAWSDGQVELTEARTGRALVHDAAVQRVQTAVVDPQPEVELPVTTTDPSVATEDLAPLVDEAEALIKAALDRESVLAGPDLERSLTPRELDATPDLDALLDELPADDRSGADTVVDPLTDAATAVPLDIPDDAVVALLEDVADEVERPARDAKLDWSSGELDIVEERTGRTLDVDATRTRLLDAIDGTGEQVEVATTTVQPAVTRDDHDQVLFLQQDRRTLRLYEDGEAVREWPVAVGQPSDPTPTGRFTVGAKRVEPTWTNPAPDGWGADLPEVVEPGPDNPLGARAINWNRDGRDTLIRFHGTNEPSSIGQAASQGCVRMHDEHVIELYDRVSSGTTIVSTAG